MDDRKSLSVAFLAISDQCGTLIFFPTKWLPADILDDRKSRSIAFLLFWKSDLGNFRMAARGHFVFPMDAKNHKVLVIWDLNGYGEYDWCICDKVMAISDQCATFFFSQNGCRRPFWMTETHFRSHFFYFGSPIWAILE